MVLKIYKLSSRKYGEGIPQFMRLLRENGFRFLKLDIKQDKFLAEQGITADKIIDFMRYEGREVGRIYFVGSKILYQAYRRDTMGREVKLGYKGRECKNGCPYDYMVKMFLNDGFFGYVYSHYRNNVA